MRISAHLSNSAATHAVVLRTGASAQALAVAAKETGGGSAVNGGEFLMLALATCWCNDLYREAAARGPAIEALLRETDADAEVHNTVRAGLAVRRDAWDSGPNS